MTSERSLDLDCPKCGIKQSVRVYDSINVFLDSTLKDKLFNGEINLFFCDNCGGKAFIPVPLLYHDMEKSFPVQFYPFGAVQDREFLSRFTKNGGLAAMEAMPRGIRESFKGVQIVFDMGEMLRYILFRERLHELWKNAC